MSFSIASSALRAAPVSRAGDHVNIVGREAVAAMAAGSEARTAGRNSARAGRAKRAALPGWSWRDLRHVIKLGKRHGASVVKLNKHGVEVFSVPQTLPWASMIQRFRDAAQRQPSRRRVADCCARLSRAAGGTNTDGDGRPGREAGQQAQAQECVTTE